MAVFDFVADRARLSRLFPDVTVGDVEAVTGFEFDVAPDLTGVPRPTPAELELIRTIDPLGVRRSEFSAGELDRTFAT
jgi:glutaconate CoA-transferase subunit B